MMNKPDLLQVYLMLINIIHVKTFLFIIMLVP